MIVKPYSNHKIEINLYIYLVNLTAKDLSSVDFNDKKAQAHIRWNFNRVVCKLDELLEGKFQEYNNLIIDGVKISDKLICDALVSDMYIYFKFEEYALEFKCIGDILSTQSED